MTTQTVDALVEDYLGRLDAAAWPLPPDRRAELVEGIREHIEEARAAGAGDELAIRGLLDRLGRPEVIVEAAAREGGAAIPPYPLVVQRSSLVHETWTVCLLTFGNLLLPVISWLAGAVLLVVGKRWLWWEKLLGVLLLPGGPLAGFYVMTFAATSGGEQHCVTRGSSTVCEGEAARLHLVGSVSLLALSLLLPLDVAYFLFRRARQRAEAEPLWALSR